ncbi:hypothetical protein C0J52_16743 [Blattella germanica]|nr:hypothetical protein C0J52_16743 [Blattella germanica]
MSKTSPQLVDHENIARESEEISKETCLGIQISDRSVRHFTRRLKIPPYKNSTCNRVFWMEIRYYRSYSTKPQGSST